MRLIEPAIPPPSSTVKKFGEKVRQLRAAQKLSQRALAKKANVALGTIQLYEKGNTIPASDVLGRIARLFQVDTDYLIFDDVDMARNIHDHELLEYFLKADRLHHRHKYLVKEFIDSLLASEELEDLRSADPALHDRRKHVE